MRTTQRREEVIERIQAACKRLFLSTAVAQRCGEGIPIQQAEFMMEVLEAEVVAREENKVRNLIRKACFPVPKTFEGYDFKKVTFPPALPRERVMSAAFVPEKENVVLYGPVGTGKTHMAVAAGTEACRQGRKVKFYTVTDLVLALSSAKADGSFARIEKELAALDLLILDEWGYVPVDREGAQLLFQIISDSYERKSLMLTTNIEFAKWGTVFTDSQMAAAMIDRLVHHGHMVVFNGKSYRMEHALMGKGSNKKEPEKQQEGDSE